MTWTHLRRFHRRIGADLELAGLKDMLKGMRREIGVPPNNGEVRGAHAGPGEGHGHHAVLPSQHPRARASMSRQIVVPPGSAIYATNELLALEHCHGANRLSHHHDGHPTSGKLFKTLCARPNVLVTTTYHAVLVSNDQERDSLTTAAARLTLAAGSRLMHLALNLLTSSTTEAPSTFKEVT